MVFNDQWRAFKQIKDQRMYIKNPEKNGLQGQKNEDF